MRAYHADSLRNVGGLITPYALYACSVVVNHAPRGLLIHTLTIPVYTALRLLCRFNPERDGGSHSLAPRRSFVVAVAASVAVVIVVS